MRKAPYGKSKSAFGIEGIRRGEIHKSTPKLSADSHSYMDVSKRDDMYTLEMRKRPSARATGLPMRKLLAEEMSKEIQHKRTTQSVIARLMGDEGLPSPSNAHRKQQESPDFYLQRNASNSANWSPHFLENLINHRSSTNQPVFKDVHEDMGGPHCINRVYSSRWNTNSFLADHDVDAEQLSTDEMLQDSGDLDGELDMLDCAKVKPQKIFKQPGSLVPRHSIGFQDDGQASIGSPITVLKHLSPETERNSKARRSRRHFSGMLHSATHLMRKDGLLLDSSDNSLTVSFEKGVDRITLPTRIVVLKPNLGKIRNAGASCSLADVPYGHLHNYHVRRNQCTTESVKETSTERYSSHQMGLLRRMPREAGEIAFQVASRMREYKDETAEVVSSAFSGYVGDGSSSESIESDSGSKFEPFRFPYRHSLDQCVLHACSSSRSGEPSMSRQNTKWLSGKLKSSRKYQELEMFNSGSTIAETLAFSERDSGPMDLTPESTSDVAKKNPFVSCSVASIQHAPLGISSKDGWEDGKSLNSSRSISKPTSLGEINHIKSEMIGTQRLPHSSGVHFGKNEAKGKCDDIENNLYKNSSFCSKKPRSFRHLNASEADPSAPNIPEKQLSDNPECVPSCCIDSNLQELPQGTFAQSSPPSRCRKTEPDSSESSKEADHPSPVSVLEIPSREYISTCENFERVSAELHELRRHLQLLKLESGTCAASTIAPVEEETTSVASESNLGEESECWRTTYAVNVLIGSGLEETDFSLLRTNWHYPENPLDAGLFDELEKKYGTGTSGSKSERKLLFDMLNADLLDVFRDHVDSYPWVMPKLVGGMNSRREKEAVGDAIDKLISRDFSKWEVEASQGELDKEMQWSDVKGEIDGVGVDIEKLLIDEVISEVSSA